MKAITIFDFKESRATKMLQEGPHSHHSIWVNNVLVLSNSAYMVFDREKNIFVFERCLQPTSDVEKLQLQITGCIRAGEEITRAIFGTLNI